MGSVSRLRIEAVDELQAGIWAEFGEPVELLDAADVATWTGAAVEEPPDSVDAPGSDLSYVAPVTVLVFRRSDQPDSLPRKSRLRWRRVPVAGGRNDAAWRPHARGDGLFRELIMLRWMTCLCVWLAVALPVAAQPPGADPFEGVPEDTGPVDTSLSLLTYDPSGSNPIDRIHRRTIIDLLGSGGGDGFLSTLSFAPVSGQLTATLSTGTTVRAEILPPGGSPGNFLARSSTGYVWDTPSSGTSFEVQHHGVTVRTDPTFINIVAPGVVTGSGTGVDISPGVRGFTMDRVGFVTSVDFSSDFAIGRSGDDGRVAVENDLTRDNELPSAVYLSESGGDLTLMVTMPGRTDLTDTISLPSGGGGTTDLQNIAGNLLPDADNTRSVGTANRTWLNGRFQNITIDGGLNVGGVSIGERIDDRVAGLLQEGANIDLSYDDSAGELTISSAAGGGGGAVATAAPITGDGTAGDPVSFSGLNRGNWSSATTYQTGDIVTYNNIERISLQDNNLNNTPLTGIGEHWSSLLPGGTYAVSVTQARDYYNGQIVDLADTFGGGHYLAHPISGVINIGAANIPTSGDFTRLDHEPRTNAEIDSRVKVWARSGDRLPRAKRTLRSGERARRAVGQHGRYGGERLSASEHQHRIHR